MWEQFSVMYWCFIIDGRQIVSTHPRVKKQVDVLVEKSLILLISCTEVLQELMSQFHNLLHSDIFTLKCKTQEDMFPLFALQ